MTEELENEKRRKTAYSLGATLLVVCFLILWYVLYEDTKSKRESKLMLCGLSAFILATVGCWFVILLFLSSMTYEAYKYFSFSQKWYSFSFGSSFVVEVLRQYVEQLIDRGMPKTPHKIIILSFILVVGWALVFYGMSKPEESQKSQESEISS